MALSASLFLSLALSLPAVAADPPTVDSILSKYVTAVGGKAAIEKVNSRLFKIKIESESMAPSQGEVYGKMPNKQASQVELSGIGTMNEGFDGAIGWVKSPWEGLRTKSGDELAKAKREAEFHRELKMKTLYPDLAYKGTEKIGEEEAYILEAKPTATSKEKFAFSTKTGLLLRQDSEFEGPQSRVNVTVLVQDYKTVDGIKVPSQLKMKYSMADQAFEFTMKFVEVKFNPPIDDSKFAKPAA